MSIEPCQLAYGRRKSVEMERLKALHLVWSEQCLAQAYHYIGRLADHIRGPMRLVNVVAVLEHLLLNPYIMVPLPVASGIRYSYHPNFLRKELTILEDIANRMISSDDSDPLIYTPKLKTT